MIGTKRGGVRLHRWTAMGCGGGFMVGSGKCMVEVTG